MKERGEIGQFIEKVYLETFEKGNILQNLGIDHHGENI